MALAKYKQVLLNEFEKRNDDWKFGHFDTRLSELRNNTSYQDAKIIILEAAREGKWPKTVKRYLCTNFATFENVSSEFNTIFTAIYTAMTAEEKKAWGFKEQ